MFPPRDPADQHRKRAFQPDGNGAAPANRSARGGIGKGATAGCQHQRRAGQQTGNHAPLTIPEMRLTIAGEDFRNRHASGVFDFCVGVSKRQAQKPGQPPPERGFPRPRQPNQDNTGARRIALCGGFRQARQSIIKDRVAHLGTER